MQYIYYPPNAEPLRNVILPFSRKRKLRFYSDLERHIEQLWVNEKGDFFLFIF